MTKQSSGFASVILVVGVVILVAVAYFAGSQSNRQVSPQVTPSPIVSDNKKETYPQYTYKSSWELQGDTLVSSNSCYEIKISKLGSISQPFSEYISSKYDGMKLSQVVANTPQYTVQSSESYTLPSLGIGEVNTIYAKAGGDWYIVSVTYIGAGEGSAPSNKPDCSNDKDQIASIIQGIAFEK